MEDLAKADAKTIKTFIDNNITAERLKLDVKNNQDCNSSMVVISFCIMTNIA